MQPKTVNLTNTGNGYQVTYTLLDGKGGKSDTTFETIEEANDWLLEELTVLTDTTKREDDPDLTEVRQEAENNALNQVAQNEADAGEEPTVQPVNETAETNNPNTTNVEKPVEKPQDQQGSKQETSSTNTKS